MNIIEKLKQLNGFVSVRKTGYTRAMQECVRNNENAWMVFMTQKEADSESRKCKGRSLSLLGNNPDGVNRINIIDNHVLYEVTRESIILIDDLKNETQSKTVTINWLYADLKREKEKVNMLEKNLSRLQRIPKWLLKIFGVS